jgi:hypothetical protein
MSRSTGADSQIPMPEVVTTKPYDWTYTTTYAGSLDDPGSGNVQWAPADPSIPHHSIPIAELSRPDPILFYAEIPLFDDELHDNGASHLLVRIVGHSYLLFPNSKPTATERAARDADMHLHTLPLHAARR